MSDDHFPDVGKKVPPAAPDDVPPLRQAVNEVMHHQFTHSRPAMHALQVLIDEADRAADEIDRLRARILELEAVHEDASGAILQAVAAERASLLALLRRCLPIIAADAQMMADITRHAPLDHESQAVHDATEYESERLSTELRDLLGP